MSTAANSLPHLSAWHSIDLGHVSPADSLVCDLPVMMMIITMIVMRMMIVLMMMVMII
jgi:hypothetical protein